MVSFFDLFLFFTSFFKFYISFPVFCHLHSEDAKLGVAGLDLVAAAHGSPQAEPEVLAGVLGRDDAVVLFDC